MYYMFLQVVHTYFEKLLCLHDKVFVLNCIFNSTLQAH